MQPSEYEIQREVEALRDLRRRSTTPLTIDPDLPNQSGGSVQRAASIEVESSESSSSSHEGSSEATMLDDNISFADDPFHLFWVPASVHPEIAPAEFRTFLKEHARAPDGSGGLSRSGSSSSALGRKKSMLSRQYRPHENDDVEKEEVVHLRRNRTSIYVNQGPQLTISDLQKLEELAEEASASDDPSKLRSVLRRSLSLNMSPTAIYEMANPPPDLEDSDAPILVPPPGQILRRAARTKIRKPGLPGDGGGHRFGSSRRGARGAQQRRQSNEAEAPPAEEPPTPRQPRFTSDVAPQPRPDSFSDVYEAYAHEEDEASLPAPILVTGSLPSHEPEDEEHPVLEPAPPELLDALGPVILQPQPQLPDQHLSPTPLEPPQGPSRTPSPVTPDVAPPTARPMPYPIVPPQQHPQPSPSGSRKEKDKKGLFGKWGSDKGGKKGHHKNHESRERQDNSFFGSLFGGSKKKQEDSHGSGVGGAMASHREAAQALLGASKSSKSYQPPPSPVNAPNMNNWSRYPIHVERAIYRLSHIKLANPRRPLYEQVLISNLMFWYLGVINNKPQTPAAYAGASDQEAAMENVNGPAKVLSEEEQGEKEQREDRERAEKERMEKEKAEAELGEREMEASRRAAEQPKRGPLTKPPPMGARRGVEAPVKGPQYNMQRRAVEQEYPGGYGASAGPGPVAYNGTPPNAAPMARSSPGSPGSSYQRGSQQYGVPLAQQQPYGGQQLPFSASTPQSQYGVPQYGAPNAQPQFAAPKLVQPQSLPPDNYYYSGDGFASPNNVPPYGGPQQRQPQLPPGAMPPMESNWSSYAAPVQSRPPNSSPSPSPSRSPPQNRYAQDTGRPTRSLSASAAPVPVPAAIPNGRIRKGTSAHAVPSGAGTHRLRTSEGRSGGEEDMPLAMWQQQQQRWR
ncbi:hypothetical protein FISHEDRAFT_69453 [Fistulina hepatica ATCC 64428]|uniref:Protein Zds1 C-terminal domain-containing protein n=1 Tax=Fistulina hepatica ATCC 64428 TaxID=1128425 RepID=A0A0D7AM99_9AGAR|nr:hypothetical protein FISHEDRAFT_69453 [Fistulina hepatica ATCC 64428]